MGVGIALGNHFTAKRISLGMDKFKSSLHSGIWDTIYLLVVIGSEVMIMVEKHDHF